MFPARLARLLKPYRFYLLLALLGALGEAVADLLQPWPLKWLFDNLIKGQPLPPVIRSLTAPLVGDSASGILYFALAAVLGIAAVSATASFAQDFFIPRIGHWVMRDLRRQLYWHIQRLSLSYHDERRVGELLNTLTGDMQTVRELIESALIGLFVNVLTLGGMVAIMAVIDWRYALLSLSITPALFAVVHHFTRRIKQAARDVRKREGAVVSVAQEVLSSIRVVQAFTREDYEQARFDRENQERIAAGIRARTLQAQFKPLVELLVAAGTVLVLWYGARQVMAGILSPGLLLVFVAYLTRLYKPMRELSKQTEILSRAGVSLERVMDLLATERKVGNLPGAQPAPRLRGWIEFDKVSFAYKEGQPVLKEVTFTVDPGQVIAVVGATGSGKTTLLSLLPRFHDPVEGSVRVDGHDIRDYTLASLRNQISLVLQETVLFHGTVRDNIAYGRPEATIEEIVAAARAANAHEFIERLPEGYDALVGERGVTLSGGQRQRIAIARAILRDAPILLLDEPTTGLDAASEALVIEGLSRLMAGRTTIMIAHHLGTIWRAHRILVMERGEIVERGTHEELLAANGRYAAFHSLQFHRSDPGNRPEGLWRIQ